MPRAFLVKKKVEKFRKIPTKFLTSTGNGMLFLPKAKSVHPPFDVALVSL